MSWVTWEPKSTIRTFSCMDGDVSRTCPESGAQRPFGAAFCGLCAAGSSLSGRKAQAAIRADALVGLLTRAIDQRRPFSMTGPIRGISEIHLPNRERPAPSGLVLSTLAGGPA